MNLQRKSKRVNIIYTDSIYTITVRYAIYMQNLDFNFKFKLYVMHLIMKAYALLVYIRLIQT